MVGAGGGWGAVWLLLLWRSAGLVWVVFLRGGEARDGLKRAKSAERRRPWYRGSAPYLERGPVHMHSGPVVVAEPLQVLLCVCAQNRALQLPVYCAVAEEKKKARVKLPAGIRGVFSVPIWPQSHSR